MVAVGRISKLFGAKGGVTLSLYDDFPRNHNIEEPVFVKIDAHTVPLFFESFVRRGVRSATAMFADIDTEARAGELIGLELSMRTGSRAGRSAQSCAGDAGDHDTGAGDELYFEDLVGWEAVLGETRAEEDGTREGENLTARGRVTAFFDSELNPLLEIELDGGRNDSSTETRRPAAGRRETVEGNNAGGRSVLIPAVDEFIVEVDEKRRRVTFDLPEGLLGLNS